MLRDRGPLILIVDHGLRDGSAKDARDAKTYAESLGLDVQVLTWAHDNPKTGLQEKARKARYGLMGQACREAGISHLLTGHTEDDQAETLLMRYERGTDWRGAVGMQSACYAPVWPELAHVTVVRPLLAITRKALRAYNRSHGLAWSEDPSNANRTFMRIRVRDELRTNGDLKALLLETSTDLQKGVETEKNRHRAFVKDHMTVNEYGLLNFSAVPPQHLLGKVLEVSAGRGDPIVTSALKRLHASMLKPDFTAATLGGAYVKAHRNGYEFSRDPVAAKGRANQSEIPTLSLIPERPVLWDGRFIVCAKRKGLMLGPLLSQPLGIENFNPGPENESLPAVWSEDGEIVSVCGETTRHDKVDIQSLMVHRLHEMLKTP